MSHYLIKQGDMIYHFFNRQYDGLCIRQKRAAGMWQDYRILCREMDGRFSVLTDGERLHLVGVNDQNELLYFLCRDGEWSKYQLSALGEEFQVTGIMLHNTGRFFQLLYTVRYQEELLLIHCILGNQAKPETIGRLSNDAVCIFKNRVYYTNSEGVLGYQELADGKPEQFFEVSGEGMMPEMRRCGGADRFVYLSDGNVMLDGEKAAEDRDAELPVLFEREHRLTILWRSGAYLRYILSADNGKSWSAPMRFLQSGQRTKLYYVQCGTELLRFYAYENGTDIHFFGGVQPLIEEPDFPTPEEEQQEEVHSMECEKLRVHMELMQKEITSLKRQLTQMKKKQEAQAAIAQSIQAIAAESGKAEN